MSKKAVSALVICVAVVSFGFGHYMGKPNISHTFNKVASKPW